MFFSFNRNAPFGYYYCQYFFKVPHPTEPIRTMNEIGIIGIKIQGTWNKLNGKHEKVIKWMLIHSVGKEEVEVETVDILGT